MEGRVGYKENKNNVKRGRLISYKVYILIPVEVIQMFSSKVKAFDLRMAGLERTVWGNITKFHG